jgi:hypothetical protein
VLLSALQQEVLSEVLPEWPARQQELLLELHLD